MPEEAGKIDGRANASSAIEITKGDHVNPYQFLPKLPGRIGLACGVLLSKFTHDLGAAIQMASGLGEALVLISIMLATVVAVQMFVSLLIDTAFQRMWIVRRALLGRWFVEGLWIEVVRLEGKPFSVSMIHISPCGYSLQISGSNYNLDGTPKDIWHSDMVEINWPVIECKHSNQGLAGKLSRLEGYGELQFANTPCRPETYTGFFCHFTEDRRYTVEAIRAHRDDRNLLAQPEGIQRLVRKYSVRFKTSTEDLSQSSERSALPPS